MYPKGTVNFKSIAFVLQEINFIQVDGKVKSVPAQVLRVQETEASRFHDNRRIKVVRLSALRTGHLYFQEIYLVIHFSERLIRTQGHNAAGRIMSMKNSNDTIGNRNRDLPACSPTACPRLMVKKVKVKESHNRPGVAQRVPGGLGSQIFMTFGT